MQKLNKIILTLIISIGFYSGSSHAYWSQKNDVPAQNQRTIPIKKIFVVSVVLGISFYFRADIRRFFQNNLTPENLEKARRIAVDDVLKPVANTVAEEGPKMIREHISKIIMATIIGGLSRVF